MAQTEKTDPDHLENLLQAFSNGDRDAESRLLELLHPELRNIARRLMRSERDGHTLQTTALVNEAYIRLVQQRNLQYANRAHFLAIAARVMRRVLVDHARGHNAKKRGDGMIFVELEDHLAYSEGYADQLLEVERVLSELEAVDSRSACAFELSYFGGLTGKEIADALPSLCADVGLTISERTVKRDLQFARAFIKRQLGMGSRDGSGLAGS